MPAVTNPKSSIKTRSSFALKGSFFTMTVLQLMDAEPNAFGAQLEMTVQKSPKFFQHAPIIIDIQALPGNQSIDFASMTAHLRYYHIIPVGVRGGTAQQQAQATAAGLALFPAEKNAPNETTVATSTSAELSLAAGIPSVGPSTADNDTTAENFSEAGLTPPITNKIITQPIRSGQQVYARGDLIVVAPVSAGAEILADGNIHVYGHLRGRALAGINGNTSARIFCQHMSAELISIAGHYLVNERVVTPAESEGSMTCIYLENGHLHITRI